MEQAIRIAIENGYKDYGWGYEKDLLNPLFWQALGRGLGWGKRYNWIHHAHKCLRHVMVGKSLDSFFEKVLTKE